MSSQAPNTTSTTERFIENIFTESRTPKNAILAIEYELNMEVADTNMLKGATVSGETFLDSISFDDLGVENGEISANNQGALYDLIANAVSEIKLSHFNNSSEGDVVLIDLRFNEEAESMFAYVVSAAKVEDYCGCSFNTDIGVDPTNPGEFDCNDFADKLDQYYQICNVTENIGYYYDFEYVTYPFTGIMFSGLGYTSTPSQQANAISSLNSQLTSYMSSYPNEYVLRRKHTTDLGFSLTMRLGVTRAKMYNGSVPF